MAPKYQKRHYEDIADSFREVYGEGTSFLTPARRRSALSITFSRS